jgi:hypothetical protein
MPKIRLANDSGGGGSYEFTYNPSEIDIPQANLGNVAVSVDTIDGESVTFYPYLDTRRGVMRWRGYPAADGSTISTNFNTMLNTYLRTYVGGYKYIHFGDISAAYDVYETWTKVKIIAVNVSLRSGGSQIYDPVELVWENAEV